ncbi:MAG: AAA family ATPase, partial [Candidatus Omnitrophica bacterium]|nr:AAA family ATPase [Candidatus Omnitrophota bacterium]
KTRLGWIDYRTAGDLIRLSGLERESESLYPLLLSLFLALNEGSLCLPLEEETLAHRLSTLVPQEMEQSIAQEILVGIRSRKWGELIAYEGGDFLPLIVHHEGENEFLYFQKYNAKEKQLAEDFARLLEVPNEQVPVDRVRPILEETLTQSPVRRGKDPVHLNIQQKVALCFSILQRVTIISGGPGTGKTSIVVSVLRALVRMGVPIDRIRLAAPTGRAANRMSESIRSAIDSIEAPSENDLALKGLEGMTLHRLLKYRSGPIPFRYHRFNPLPADLVVIDEVSMVDVVLMADLISAIRPGTRLILLGDKDQLPSVEAGAVLGNLIPGLIQSCLSTKGKEQVESLLGETIGTPASRVETRAADRVILLDTSYRSEASILRVADEINRGDLCALEQLGNHRLGVENHPDRVQIEWPIAEGEGGKPISGLVGGGVRWIDASDNGTMDWMRVLDSWIDCHFLQSEKGVRPFFALTGKPLSTIGAAKGPEEERLTALFRWLESSRILCLPRKGPYGVEWVNRHVSARMKEATGYTGRGNIYPGLPILILQNDLSLGLF